MVKFEKWFYFGRCILTKLWTCTRVSRIARSFSRVSAYEDPVVREDFLKTCIIIEWIQRITDVTLILGRNGKSRNLDFTDKNHFILVLQNSRFMYIQLYEFFSGILKA